MYREMLVETAPKVAEAAQPAFAFNLSPLNIFIASINFGAASLIFASLGERRQRRELVETPVEVSQQID